MSKPNSTRGSEITVLFASHNPDEGLWKLLHVKAPALISLTRPSHGTEKIPMPDGAIQEVCYRRPNVRAWSIHWIKDVMKQVRLYDESGTAVHLYILSNKGRLLKHSSRSPNRVNRNRRKHRKNSGRSS